MEAVADCAGGQARTEGHVPAPVHRVLQFEIAHRPFERREQIGQGLRVVPDMGTGSGATAIAVRRPLPAPHHPVLLSQHGRRLEDAQVGRHGIEHIVGQGGTEQRAVKSARAFLQRVVGLETVARYGPGVVRSGSRRKDGRWGRNNRPSVFVHSSTRYCPHASSRLMGWSRPHPAPAPDPKTASRHSGHGRPSAWAASAAPTSICRPRDHWSASSAHRTTRRETRHNPPAARGAAKPPRY